MNGTDTLADLPLSSLFSGPLVAAVEASIQAQSESLSLIREVAFDDGELVTVSFEYRKAEVDPDTGEERQVTRHLTVPILLFLSVPELVVHEIEQEFSAKIVDTETEEGEEDSESTGGSGLSTLAPSRLRVSPASEETTFSRKTKAKFDLDVRMVAEIESRSTGMEMLERTANGAIREARGPANRREAVKGREAVSREDVSTLDETARVDESSRE
ncbi:MULTISPECIES: DUF2589 domain-containing protein [Haloferacaceae]|uniref:DUF2589 domain-containing protein n=1 Tax=Halorubrum glutamatedens TaxID=2707018 RepID=A0ABD5QPL3_9EURY|nr:DUF2589 domain-containing protein [Halobellus captivus]